MYLLGLGCVSIAVKYNEVKTMSMGFIEARLGHYEYSKDEIARMEREVLQICGFRIPYRLLI